MSLCLGFHALFTLNPLPPPKKKIKTKTKNKNKKQKQKTKKKQKNGAVSSFKTAGSAPEYKLKTTQLQ